MIKYLPYAIGSIVRLPDKGFAIVNRFSTRGDEFIYSLTHFKLDLEGNYIFRGKSAWHENEKLTLYQAPSLTTMQFLDEHGDL